MYTSLAHSLEETQSTVKWVMPQQEALYETDNTGSWYCVQPAATERHLILIHFTV